MKTLLLRALFVLAMIPLVATADIESDMQNSELSLAQVVQNALDEGMAMDEVVARMIDVDPDQSNAIIAAAIVVEPGSYDSVIQAAINAGVNASDVMQVAVAASPEANTQGVISSTKAYAPANELAEVRETEQALTRPGATARRTAVRGQLVTATTLSASGGGSASTAETVDQILAASAEFQESLASVEQSLANAGFTAAEVETAVDQIVSALGASESTVDLAVNLLTELETLANDPSSTKEDLQSGIEETLADVEESVASPSGGASTS